jgi:hypothetical protein
MKSRAELATSGADLLFVLAKQRIDELQCEGWRRRVSRAGRKVETDREG